MAPLELLELETALDNASGAVPLYAIFPVVEFPVNAKMYAPFARVTVPCVHDWSLAPPAVTFTAVTEHFTLPDVSVIAQL